MILEKACPICGGDVYSEDWKYGTDYECVQAGHTVSEEHIKDVIAERAKAREEAAVLDEAARKEVKVGTKGKRGGAMKVKHEFYEANKLQIINDFLQAGKKQMLSNWGMSDTGWFINC